MRDKKREAGKEDEPVEECFLSWPLLTTAHCWNCRTKCLSGRQLILWNWKEGSLSHIC